ncbi:MAG TPA: hypothetical protein VNL17_11880 [Verrucomicrobiae bacterium]|nr:hypothetical protein [Verrucomicrobiae bacterium]
MNKGIMGIRTIIAIGFTLAVVNAQAATNSWIFGGSDFWDVASRWSLGHAPASSDSAIFVTNTTAKTVTIDDTDTSFFPSTLTISNLTVAGPASATTTNTLNLTNMNLGALVPLNVINTLTIGARGQLQFIRSMLHAGNASIDANAVLLFGLGTNSSSVVVSNNLTLGGKLNVADSGGFFTAGSYTLFTYGGALTYNGLTVGTTPSNTTCTIDTSVSGLVKLTVSGFVPPPSTGTVQLVSIVRSTNNIAITWAATGGTTSRVQVTSGTLDGSYSSNNFVDISASQFIAPGSGLATNTYIEVGGATNAPSRFYRVRLSQ